AAIQIEASVTWLSACGERDALVELYLPGTNQLAYQYNVTINSMGQFQIDGVPLGEYDVYLKVNGYLTKTIGIQEVTTNTEFNFLAITPGDLNGDNLVNINDLSLINLSCAKTSEDEAYNILADLNCDGAVNILD